MKLGFHYRIVIPVVLTIAAFIIAFNVIFLPTFEKNLIDKKKEMIRELRVENQLRLLPDELHATLVLNREPMSLIQLGIKQLGPPPAPFAFISMGSEGRQEQSLVTDQDNGIISADEIHGASAAGEYFLSLGDYVNRSLDEAGYSYCTGGVMARNPKWCKPLSSWKQDVAEWIQNADPRNLLDENIFFDFRYVYGDENLVAGLRKRLNELSQNKPVFLLHMAQQVLHFKPALDVFGNLHFTNEGDKTTKSIDLKKSLMPIVSFARVYALKYQMEQTNTLSRLEKLVEKGHLTPDLSGHMALVFEEGTLKKALSLITEIQSLVKTDFPMV